MELADTAVLSTEVLLTLSAATSPSVHGMASFYCNSIFLFKLVDQEWRHLVRIARQLRSWWLRIKPCTHRVVHVNALQRIRVLLVTSLAALLHHGVTVLLGFEDAKLLGWIYLALRHKLGTWLHRYAMDWRIQGWTHLALFTVCVRLF